MRQSLTRASKDRLYDRHHCKRFTLDSHDIEVTDTIGNLCRNVSGSEPVLDTDYSLTILEQLFHIRLRLPAA